MLAGDAFFNTENFFYMLGDLLTGAHLDYLGRIIPVSVRINMALKGIDDESNGPGGRGAGAAAGIGGLMVRYPDITYDDGYTEVLDETAYGYFLDLVASAGLAYDHAYLDYISEGKLNIKRTQHDMGDDVTWHVERKQPNAPLTPPPVAHVEDVKE